MHTKVFDLLEGIDPFPARTDTRANVRMPGQTEPYYHFAMGRVGVFYRTGVAESRFNARYPDLLTALEQLMKAWDPAFEYDTIQVNKDQQMPAHRDARNVGISYTIALGEFTGGNLMVYRDPANFDKYAPKTAYNIKERMLAFNGGACTHSVSPIRGRRYSLVYFKIR
jgi:hypothetical protein